jgi:hypothetical protein
LSTRISVSVSVTARVAVAAPAGAGTTSGVSELAAIRWNCRRVTMAALLLQRQSLSGIDEH